jgi:hypothetical protein
LLEGRLTPKVDAASSRVADLLRERRRRRLEASGVSFEELDWGSLGLPPGTRLSVRETRCFARQLLLKRDRKREERDRQAAISERLYRVLLIESGKPMTQVPPTQEDIEEVRADLERRRAVRLLWKGGASDRHDCAPG